MVELSSQTIQTASCVHSFIVCLCLAIKVCLDRWICICNWQWTKLLRHFDTILKLSRINPTAIAIIPYLRIRIMNAKIQSTHREKCVELMLSNLGKMSMLHINTARVIINSNSGHRLEETLLWSGTSSQTNFCKS